MALRQDGLVLAGMAPGRCHEANATVMVLMVVPADEALHPLLRSIEVGEARHRVVGPVLARAERRLGVGVAVADPRSAGRLDIEIMQLLRQGGALEGAAVVGMQHQQLVDDLLGRYGPPFDDGTRVQGRLSQEELPADDLAAEDVQDHHQVVVTTLDRPTQPGAIPRPDLVRRGRMVGRRPGMAYRRSDNRQRVDRGPRQAFPCAICRWSPPRSLPARPPPGPSGCEVAAAWQPRLADVPRSSEA